MNIRVRKLFLPIILFLILAGVSNVHAQQFNQSNHLIVSPPEKVILVGKTFSLEFKFPFNFELSSSDIQIDGETRLVDERNSYQTFILNGVQRNYASRLFEFQAVEEGTITVAPISISQGSNQYQFEPFEIEVKSEEAFGIERFEIPELGKISHPIADNVMEMKNLTGKYFSAVDVPEYVWEGQIFPVVTYMYKENTPNVAWVSSADIQVPDNSDLIEIESFNTKRSNDLVETVLDGKYQRIAFHAQLVLPIRSGKIEVTGSSIPAGKITRRFFSFERMFDLLAPSRELEVRPLPDPDRPVNSKLVGVVELAQNFNTSNAEVGDIVSVDVLLSGLSYLKPVSLSVAEDIPGLLYLGTTSDFDIQSRGQIPVNSRKQFTLKYQVLEPGLHTLPSLVFAAFDSDTEKYVYHNTPVHEFEATGTTVGTVALSSSTPDDASISNSPEAPVVAEEKQSIGPLDIDRYLQENRRSSLINNPPPSTIIYISNAALIFLGVFFFVLRGFVLPSSWYRNRNSKLSKSRELREHLTLARNAAKQNDPETFYQESERFLVSCFQDAYGFNMRGLDTDELEKILSEYLDDNEVREVMDLRDKLDNWRYAPDSQSQDLSKEVSLLDRILTTAGAVT